MPFTGRQRFLHCVPNGSEALNWKLIKSYEGKHLCNYEIIFSSESGGPQNCHTQREGDFEVLAQF